jgi:hypothetical protein
MAQNTTDMPVYVAKLTCSASDQREDFGVPVKQINLIADGDCFINFHQPVTATSRFLLKANIPVTIDVFQVSNIHYLADSATPAIYVCATR